MFKKRANNQKKVDLQQETDQIVNKQQSNPINSQPQNSEQSSLPQKGPLYRHKNKHNSITLQVLQKAQASQIKASFVQSQPVENSEIEQCFSEYIKLKQAEPIIEEQFNGQMSQGFRQSKLILVQDKNQDAMDEQQYNYGCLEIEIDEDGGFSPEVDYQENQRDYEDELIRKTLTKKNYQNLSIKSGFNLNKLKHDEHKDNLLEKLKKINAGTVKKAISRDIHNKRLKLNQMNRTLKNLSENSGSRKTELSKKEQNLSSLHEQFAKITKVIEHIYYWGDKVEEFTVDSICKQIKDRQNRSQQFSLYE